MATLLARKANGETPIATDDDHHEALASDPSISAFPAGSGFGAVTTTTQSTSTTSFGGPMPTTNSGFGAPATGGFGAAPLGGNTMSVAPQQQQQQAVIPQPQYDTKAGDNAAQGAEFVANDNTDWINKKWRPVMGWVYMMTCTADFVVFPILWSLLQALSHGQVTSQWQPLTLQGAGLYHISMGAVLGIAAYGRTKEKVAGAA